jgi:hypothetical protein
VNGAGYPDCRVRPGAKLSLADLPTEVEPAYTSDDDARRAYEDCIEATSTDNAPWHLVPADDKKNARLIVSAIVDDTLAAMDPRIPEPTPARRAELERCRALLRGAKGQDAGRDEKKGARKHKD